MAEIRCSNCGNNNPDFLDVCQFCQTPLEHEATVHIGEEPTKKDTGELEEVLPDWLKDARKQGKNEEAADDVFRSQTRPKVPKEEPPDLLAGLMSQSDADDDEVPDWLASINPVAEKKSETPKPTQKDDPSDFFAQFRETEQPAPVEREPAQDNMQAWMGTEEKPVGQTDEPIDRFSQPSADAAPVSFDAAGAPASDDDWLKGFGSFDSAEEKTPPQQEPEDLGWLHNLEAASKGTSDLPAPKKDAGFDFPTSSASSDEDDLSWLNNLGGTSAPSFEEPAPAQPASSDEDLSWLNKLGGTSAPSFEEPAPAQPASSDEDLSWLNNLGGTSAPSFEEPAPAQPASSDEDLSWLNNLGGTSTPSFEEPAPTQPASSDEDLSWLNNLSGTPVSPSNESAPTQPPASDEDLGWLKSLGETSAQAFEESAPAQPISSDDDLSWLNNLGGTSAPSFEEPAPAQPASSNEDLDWLSSLGATSEPSEVTSSAFTLDEESQAPETTPGVPPKPFRTAPLKELIGDESQDSTPDWLKNAMEEPSMPAPGAVSMDWFSEHSKPADSESVPTQDEPGSTQPAFDFSGSDSSSTSAQDVDSLFDMEMPDWLSQEPESVAATQPEGSPADEDDTLSPVELPSWVQAMRPVDSAIDNATASTVDQITEREGPLAGFRGVIPSAPIGSSLRPKAFSLKLQTTEEQQTSATLLEQIIAGETTVGARKEATGISSQKVLRWVLSALFLVVLGVVLGFNLKTIPIIPSNQLSDIVVTIPDSSPVLVVIDYEPSFTGELEASAGPLLDQLALSKRSTFSFVSMSPNGSALVDRLMLNTGITGLGYQPGTQYSNLGFLPGGSAGVLGFIENPADEFSKFEAVILMTDNAETGRVWVEQLGFAKSKYQALAGKPLIVVSSAQSAPLLQPYVSAGQVDIMVNGLSDAAKYESMNNTRPGMARSYWDAFGIGLTMAVIAIILGSVWSVLMLIRERRAEAEQG